MVRIGKVFMGIFVSKADIKRKWYVIDAEGVPLGRLTSKVAKLLMGKHKPEYAPHVDSGDHVVIINASRVGLSGNKREKKVYRHHSSYPGGLKEVMCKVMLSKHPERVIELAVKRMLPKNTLGSKYFTRLKVYAGSEHSHSAQQPEIIDFEVLKKL